MSDNLSAAQARTYRIRVRRDEAEKGVLGDDWYVKTQTFDHMCRALYQTPPTFAEALDIEWWGYHDAFDYLLSNFPHWIGWVRQIGPDDDVKGAEFLGFRVLLFEGYSAYEVKMWIKALYADLLEMKSAEELQQRYIVYKKLVELHEKYGKDQSFWSFRNTWGEPT